MTDVERIRKVFWMMDNLELSDWELRFFRAIKNGRKVSKSQRKIVDLVISNRLKKKDEPA